LRNGGQLARWFAAVMVSNGSSSGIVFLLAAIADTSPASIPMIRSTVALYVVAFTVCLVWADRDAAASFKRCQTLHTADHCRLIHWGR